jgi:plastocyanin
VFPDNKPIPARATLDVTQDKPHCLKNGPILDEAVVVNPKNRGVKNVVVWLRPFDPDVKAFPKDQIHPVDAQRKPAEVVIDQPCCMFVPRITTARVGDTVVVKNSAPVPHNFFCVTGSNGSHNPTIAAGGKFTFPNPLVAESTPIQYKCTIHPWMSGFIRIFDHPYYAITDENGDFAIHNAPPGKWRIVFWHENGLRGGKDGRFGEPLTITGPTLELQPTEYDVSPK